MGEKPIPIGLFYFVYQLQTNNCQVQNRIAKLLELKQSIPKPCLCPNGLDYLELASKYFSLGKYKGGTVLIHFCLTCVAHTFIFFPSPSTQSRNFTYC
jgi:hypothetical protein